MTTAQLRAVGLARGTQPGLARLARGATLALLAGVVLLLPFEGLFLTIETRDHPWTDLELLTLLTLGAWVVTLVLEHRRPGIPRSVALGVAVLATVWLLSSLGAGEWSRIAFVNAGRAALAWGTMLLAIDLVRRPADASRLITVLLAGTCVAAAIGYLALARGSVEGLPGPVRLYTVAGVPRLTGTFDYPTIAASVLATALMLAVPLAVERRGWARLIVVGAMVTIGTALLLTLSRGALLGLGAGVVVLVVLAVSARRRPLAVAAAATGGMVAAGAVALAFLGPLPPQRMVMEGDRGLYAARYLVTGHLALAPGERRDVRVTVTNTGLATWSDEGPDAVRLVQRWRLPNAQGSIRRADAPVALPAPVPSGATISLTATVTAPAVMGEMRLAWDMEQGRMGGFSERAVPVAVTEVLVTTAPATRVEGEDPAATELLYPGLMLEPTRGELWHAAVAIAAERPLLGSGPGTFRRIYGAYLGWSRWDPQVHSNSLYLEMAATTGVVGLIACLLLIAALVAPQVRSVIGRAPPGTPDGAGGDRRGLDPRRAGLVAAFVAATAVALAHGLVDVFLAFLPTAILFWGVLGVGLGLALGGESRRARVTA